MCAVLLLANMCQWAATDTASSDREDGLSVEVSPRRLQVEDKYPKDLLLEPRYRDDPNRWLVFFHCIGIGYMLLGLNTVCDVYFTGALEEMVDAWNVQPDVAGATFMAAGGSAPEFFTSLIGTTIAINDVGFSTIVGSAVFNVLFVIGLCGWVAPEAMELSWWPLFRDCSYYIVGLSLLAIFASDQLISLPEAIVLFCTYLIYCVIMYFNRPLEESVKNMLGAKRVAPDSGDAELRNAGEAWQNSSPAAPNVDLDRQPQAGNGSKEGNEDVKMEEADDVNKKNSDPEAAPEVAHPVPEKDDKDDVEKGEAGKDKEEAGEGDDDDDDDEPFINKPEGLLNQVIWAISLPVYVPLWYLIPQPSSEKKFGIPVFLLSFIIALGWIAGFSFLLVWWVEILGEVLHVDEILMGFTILAAGTSIPDAVSSMAVAKRGQGDMAVSSSIGSNIFDILVGLPIPWIIKTGIIHGGDEEIRFKSPYLTFYVLLLLSMVVITVVSIHCLGWKLNNTLGGTMAVLYVIFLTTALIVEFTEPEALRTAANS